MFNLDDKNISQTIHNVIEIADKCKLFKYNEYIEPDDNEIAEEFVITADIDNNRYQEPVNIYQNMVFDNFVNKLNTVLKEEISNYIHCDEGIVLNNESDGATGIYSNFNIGIAKENGEDIEVIGFKDKDDLTYIVYTVLKNIENNLIKELMTDVSFDDFKKLYVLQNESDFVLSENLDIQETFQDYNPLLYPVEQLVFRKIEKVFENDKDLKSIIDNENYDSISVSLFPEEVYFEFSGNECDISKNFKSVKEIDDYFSGKQFKIGLGLPEEKQQSKMKP